MDWSIYSLCLINGTNWSKFFCFFLLFEKSLQQLNHCNDTDMPLRIQFYFGELCISLFCGWMSHQSCSLWVRGQLFNMLFTSLYLSNNPRLYPIGVWVSTVFVSIITSLTSVNKCELRCEWWSTNIQRKHTTVSKSFFLYSRIYYPCLWYCLSVKTLLFFIFI